MLKPQPAIRPLLSAPRRRPTRLTSALSLAAMVCSGGTTEPVSPDEAAIVSKTTQTSPDDPPLTYDGRPLSEWLEVMKSLDFQSRDAAAAVPGLLEIIQDRNLPWYTRRQAALTLGRIGRPAQVAVPVLEMLLAPPPDADHPSTAAWAAKALSLFGPQAAPATPALTELLSDSQRSHLERLSCVEALARIGGAHQDAIPALIRLVQTETSRSDSAVELRQAAADGLALVGPAAAPAVPALIQLTRDDSWRLRRAAVVALGSIGPAAGIAASSLAEAVLFDDLPEVRKAAAASLATIGESGEAGLRKLLTDEDPAVRQLAAEALRGVLRISASNVASLTAALNDSDPTVRIAAAETLWKTAKAADPLLPTILDTLTCEDRLLRIRAYRLLLNLGPAAKPALPELERLSGDVRPHVRQVAEKALRELRAANADQRQSPL